MDKILPVELQCCIVEHLLLLVTMPEAVGYRLVSKFFDDAVMRTLGRHHPVRALDYCVIPYRVPADVEFRFFEYRAGDDMSRLPMIRDQLDSIFDRFCIGCPKNNLTDRASLRTRLAFLLWRLTFELDPCVVTRTRTIQNADDARQIKKDERASVGILSVLCDDLTTFAKAIDTTPNGLNFKEDMYRGMAPGLVCHGIVESAVYCNKWEFIRYILEDLEDSKLEGKIKEFARLAISYEARELLTELLRYMVMTDQSRSLIKSILNETARENFSRETLDILLAAMTDEEQRAVLDPEVPNISVLKDNVHIARHAVSLGVQPSPEHVYEAIFHGSLKVTRYFLLDLGVPLPVSRITLATLENCLEFDDIEMLKVLTDAGLDLRKLAEEISGRDTACSRMIRHNSTRCLRHYVELYGQLDSPIDNAWSLTTAFHEQWYLDGDTATTCQEDNFLGFKPKDWRIDPELMQMVLESGAELQAEFMPVPLYDMSCLTLLCPAHLALTSYSGNVTRPVVRRMVEKYINADDRISQTQKDLFYSNDYYSNGKLPLYKWYPIGWQLMPNSGNDAPEESLQPVNFTM